jgi:hypothetical protein
MASSEAACQGRWGIDLSNAFMPIPAPIRRYIHARTTTVITPTMTISRSRLRIASSTDASCILVTLPAYRAVNE